MPRVVVGSFFAAPAASTVKSLPRCLATQARPMIAACPGVLEQLGEGLDGLGRDRVVHELKQLAHAEKPYRCMVS
jgi:hypothetical protein